MGAHGLMTLEYSGEFVVPGQTPVETLQEHVARYLFAAPHVGGKRVLDIASGTGYGAAMLARNGARSVVGVDRSAEAAAFAAHHYGRDVHFVCADIREIPFVRGSFDVVTSFETIEHISDHERFLDECRRVLAPGGLFICSSPNKRAYSLGRRRPINPYHVREFTAAEFRRLLAAGIGGPVRMFAQHTMDLRQRVIYELWNLDCRLPFLAPLLNRVRSADAQRASAPSGDPLTIPPVDPAFHVTAAASTLRRPATFFVAVCERR